MAMTNMSVVAAMQLQPFKCNVVPCVQWSDSDRDRIKLWLELTLPGWSKFDVAPVAEYLGSFSDLQLRITSEQIRLLR